MFCRLHLIYYICPSILRGGAVVARWAHNPKVGGSNPPSATKKKPCRESDGDFCFWPVKSLILKGTKIKRPTADAEGGCRAFWLGC